MSSFLHIEQSVANDPLWRWGAEEMPALEALKKDTANFPARSPFWRHWLVSDMATLKKTFSAADAKEALGDDLKELQTRLDRLERKTNAMMLMQHTKITHMEK